MLGSREKSSVILEPELTLRTFSMYFLVNVDPDLANELSAHLFVIGTSPSNKVACSGNSLILAKSFENQMSIKVLRLSLLVVVNKYPSSEKVT